MAVRCPGGVPGTNSGRPRDTWDICAWFMCKPILKGQNVPGTDGTYHGTDGTCPRDRRDAHQGVSCQNSLCLLVFFFPHWRREFSWIFWHGIPLKLRALKVPTPAQCRLKAPFLSLKGYSWGLRGTSLNEIHWQGSPCRTSSWSFSLKFRQFCCADSWEFRAEVFAEVFVGLNVPAKQARKLRGKLRRKLCEKLRPELPPSKTETSPKTSLCRNPLLRNTAHPEKRQLIEPNFISTWCL